MTATTYGAPLGKLKAEREETATRPDRPVTGPVLMADILTTTGGRPTLLKLWDEWEERHRQHRDDGRR